MIKNLLKNETFKIIFCLGIKLLFILTAIIYSIYLCLYLNKPYIISLMTIMLLIVTNFSSIYENIKQKKKFIRKKLLNKTLDEKLKNKLYEEVNDKIDDLQMATIAICLSFIGWILFAGYLNISTKIPVILLIITLICSGFYENKINNKYKLSIKKEE